MSTTALLLSLKIAESAFATALLITIIDRTRCDEPRNLLHRILQHIQTTALVILILAFLLHF